MNPNEYMNDGGSVPMTPLPAPGEALQVYPAGGSASGDGGSMGGNGNGSFGNGGNGGFGSDGSGNGSFGNGNDNGESGGLPVIPLPNPGEGGPVYPGEGEPAYPDMGGNGNPPYPGGSQAGHRPGVPGPGMSPAPGAFPGRPAGSHGVFYPTGGNIHGAMITVLPRPVTPCFYCNSNSYGTIRFLNAAIGYDPFVVSVNNRTAVDMLSYAEVSEYGRVSSGYQTITIAGANGYIYVSKQIRITVGATMTVAIVNTAGGLNITEISDVVCRTPFGGSCLRVCNLSYNAGPLSLSAYSGSPSFQNVNFMEVTDYVRVVPARYEIFVSNANEALVSTEITARSGSQYTVYLFNWTESPTAIRTLIIEDRK